MIFNGWYELLRVAIVAPLAYLGLIVFLRISGKRTLAKLNAFDLVVTVALGSTLATTLLSSDIALMEGLLAFVALIVLQFSIAWMTIRSKQLRRLLKAEPTLLFHRGELLDRALRSQRVAPEEVRAAIRASGIESFAQVEAVVLETNGELSVVRRSDAYADALVKDIPDYP